MRSLICGRVFLISAFIFTGAACWGQQSQKAVQADKVWSDKISIDLGATFAGERSKPDPSRCCFWFKGGGIDAAATFWKGFGIAATFTGDHAADYLPSTDENKFAFLAGPRFTFTAWKGNAGKEDPRRLQVFGEGLFGVGHGFDTRFDNGETHANLIAVQTGGGLNYFFKKNWGVRPIEIDFVRTQIGATGFSTQNDLRLGAGVTYHFQVARHRKVSQPAPPSR